MATMDGTRVTSEGGKIQVLPSDVVSRIAAGEVVERPAAVVKELIENSLDAGARTISVDIRDGGLRSIRVTDDGEGMCRSDALLAFDRHATSKLRSDQDLRLIRTMGFRGEALPSIASVSKVLLVTASRAEPTGTRLSLSGGTVGEVEDAAAPEGTRVEVNELFFNTPARRKFLRTVTTEFSHISQVVQHVSLARPDVHVRLRHNAQDVLDFPAVQAPRERVLQVYRRRFLDQCRETHAQRDGLTLHGFVVDPAHSRTGRSPQDLFINRRPVKSPTVTHAVYEAYGSFLPRGRHPQFVLFLELDTDLVDVNVHPTKREVRFLNQELVYREVRRAVREALGPPSGEPRLRDAPASDREPAPEVRTGQQPGNPAQGGERNWRAGHISEEGRAEPAQVAFDLGGRETGGKTGDAIQEASGEYRSDTQGDVLPLGQVRRTFLIAQVGNELQVVDQHTAHERVLFERLRRAWAARDMATQPLLIPEPLELPAHAAVLLQRHGAELEKLGIVVEPFGAQAFVIREIPAMLGRLDYAALVHDLVDDLAQWTVPTALEARVQPILATLACHAAVRAGRPMDLPEIKQLIEDWGAEGFPMTCPHGRRVALRLSVEELEKIFSRA